MLQFQPPVALLKPIELTNVWAEYPPDSFVDEWKVRVADSKCCGNLNWFSNLWQFSVSKIQVTWLSGGYKYLGVYQFHCISICHIWVAVEIMFMGNWPCPNWVVPYRLWRFWISWVFTIWNDQGFRSRSIVMECWSLINPGLLADRVFSLACPGVALRAASFNSGPCVDVSSRCWHSWRMPACSSFVLLLYLPIQKCETGETFNNSLVNFLGPKLQDEIESGLSKCGACPSASMKPYMKGIGRYRLGYRLRTPAFSPESVSGHSLQ